MRRARQTHIFATRSDLILGLRKIEGELGVKYIRSDGLRYEPNFEQFNSLIEWEGLGQNTTGDHINGYHILVIPGNCRIKVERIPQKGGGVRYSLSQRLNPDSISFLPGGLFSDQKILVCGHIGTMSESQASISLYKVFVRAVTKGFEKIGSYRVGPEAARLMDEGYRMVTIGITSPTAYDLRRYA